MKGIGTFLAGTGRSSHPGIPRAVLGRSAGAVGTSRPCPVTPASVSAGSGAAFAVQKLARQKLPYSLQWSLLLAAGKYPARAVQSGVCHCHGGSSLAPATSQCPGPQGSGGFGAAGAAGTPRSTSAAPAAGSLGSYVVTRAETQKCSNFWIYLETGKSPQEFAVTGGVSQPAGTVISSYCFA